MFVWSFFWFLLLISLLNMATRGKGTKFSVEKAMLMLDSSFSGSELEGLESDDSLDGYWQNEENEQEAGCTDGRASHDSGGAASTEPFCSTINKGKFRFSTCLPFSSRVVASSTSARVSSGSVDVSPSTPSESWLAPPSARVSSAKARERVILKAMLNLNMKPLRVVRECVGLYGGKTTKGLGYETVEKNTLLPLAVR